MANGRVCTGFSKPYVAAYSESSGTITYSNLTNFARGVDVSISPETGSDNKFYADNQAAEVASGKFTGGKFSLTVDGLKADAEKMIMGLPTADTAGWMAYDNTQEIPYVGFGFIARYVSGGVESFVPVVLAKCVFDQIEISASTQEENISFQTQKLGGQILVADDENKTWKYMGKEYATEALAEAALKTKLGGTAG